MTAAIPFGLGRTKPKHFRDMAGVAWANRDNLGYAWQVLSRGVCDGCALGAAGLHDWTIDGVHLCMTRLNLLRLNTMPALDPARLADAEALRGLRNDQLRDLGRLPAPLLRERGDRGFRRIAWDETYARIAARIRASGPRRIAFFLTARALTNEVYYVAQKVARFLGSNNIDNAARLCHSPSTGAMKRALGVAASTCSYRDWWGTDLIVFFGSNPANDQPVAMKYLHEAKRRGTRVVLVNPMREPGMERYWVPSTPASAVFGTDIADYWFPVAQRGDIAFLSGVIKILIERGWIDRDFVDRHTTGFGDLAAAVAPVDWPTLEAQAGMPRASMEEFAGLIRDARTAVLVWSMGITQHASGGEAVQMIVNLGLLRGYVGRERCGLMPIRGHSGVQGGAEMGAYATALPGGIAIGPDAAQALSLEYGFPVPDAPGLTAPEMVEAAERGDLDLLYSLGGNLLRTLPDPAYVADALSILPMRVHQDIIFTDQMLIPPASDDGQVLLLPAKTRYEQEGGGTQTSTERRVMFSPELPRAVGEARTEWRILLELAAAVDPPRAGLIGCASGPAIREEIARVVPLYQGIQRLQAAGESFQYGGPHLAPGGHFPTADGRARLIPVALPAEDRPPGTFVVSSRRGKQFNTLIYAEVDPLTGAARDAVFIHPDDAAALHLSSGDRIALVSANGRFEGRVQLAPIARGNLQAHWPESNPLLARGVVDPLGGVPDYMAVVRIERV
ncbi:MAG TPA: FdhF/YdeP family oxidoreductase [Candidatus Dormibacteraeota bacterium]|nr:FdhF/YdeP family oxidoreductase [Candidatus Dormibacteraeota bacterium]